MEIAKLIDSVSQRIGLNDPKLNAKTAELFRIVDMKLPSRTRNTSFNQITKICICIDLASDFLHTTVEKNALLKVSGLKKAQYEQLCKTVSKLLNIKNELSLNELVVKFEVCSARELAVEILDAFRQKSSGDLDFDHPQYKVMAIFCACKLLKLKIQKKKCLELGSMNDYAFKILLDKFNVFIKENNFQSIPESSSNTTKKKTDDNLEEITVIEESKENVSPNQDETIETYDTWKARVLKNAHEQLQLLYSN